MHECIVDYLDLSFNANPESAGIMPSTSFCTPLYPHPRFDEYPSSRVGWPEHGLLDADKKGSHLKMCYAEEAPCISKERVVRRVSL